MTEFYGPLPAGVTRATDFEQAAYDRQAVSLVDLLRARMAKGERVVKGVTFTDCRIEGPAVMLVLGCQFEGSDFGNPSGDIRNLILRPASQSAVIGAIPVDSCSFTRCAFVGVGYTGADHFLDQLLALGKQNG
ncbi:hypothetical protein GVN21_14025 [Caulobacter sp. SLTY]|uniref:hypothetical protein n=1 Tax=Caulobacter sp. SLTY TaxID=2683262 RepID=UPI0014120F1A|nr:hypothetical protein [Caulobacter sp. SLTY]NBB16479.1 hypothetical protein [Caulobacter sp. SLTY]